jgi:hypothetical protein
VGDPQPDYEISSLLGLSALLDESQALAKSSN